MLKKNCSIKKTIEWWNGEAMNNKAGYLAHQESVNS